MTCQSQKRIWAGDFGSLLSAKPADRGGISAAELAHGERAGAPSRHSGGHVGQA